MVGDDFHGQVRFAVSGAATDGSANAGSIFRIDPVHVERDVVAGSAASGHAQRLFDDGAHSALVNVAHSEDFDSGFADILFFDRINVANADQHAVFWIDLWRKIEDVSEFGGPQTHNCRERHAMHVAAGRAVGSVDVGMSIDPD